MTQPGCCGAVRLAGELGFRIEPDTVRSLLANSHLLPKVAPDRVRDEFLRILAPSGARARVDALDQLGLFKHIVPELMVAKGVEQPRMHYWDVWGHSLHTVEAAEGVTAGTRIRRYFPAYPGRPKAKPTSRRWSAMGTPAEPFSSWQGCSTTSPSRRPRRWRPTAGPGSSDTRSRVRKSRRTG